MKISAPAGYELAPDGHKMRRGIDLIGYNSLYPINGKTPPFGYAWVDGLDGSFVKTSEMFPLDKCFRPIVAKPEPAPMPEPMHAGILYGRVKSCRVWHFERTGKYYWSGCTHHRSPKELYDECKTIIADLEKNHPEIINPPVKSKPVPIPRRRTVKIKSPNSTEVYSAVVSKGWKRLAATDRIQMGDQKFLPHQRNFDWVKDTDVGHKVSDYFMIIRDVLHK